MGWVVGGGGEGWGLLRHLSSYSSSTLFPHPPYCFVKLVSLYSLSLSPCWLPSKCNLINVCRLLMFDSEIIWQNATCLHCTLLWMYSGDSVSKLKFWLNSMSVAYSLIGNTTQLKHWHRRGEEVCVTFYWKSLKDFFFDVSLTVHLTIFILVINPLNTELNPICQ